MGITATRGPNLNQTATVASSGLQRQDVIGLMSDASSTSPVQIPPRTTLYALEELGANTGLVEGITSYVMRLANEHSITVGDLVTKVFAQIPTLHGRIMSSVDRATGQLFGQWRHRPSRRLGRGSGSHDRPSGFEASHSYAFAFCDRFKTLLC